MIRIVGEGGLVGICGVGIAARFAVRVAEVVVRIGELRLILQGQLTMRHGLVEQPQFRERRRQVGMRLHQVRRTADGIPVSTNGARLVVVGAERVAEIVVVMRGVGRQFDGGAERERRLAVTFQRLQRGALVAVGIGGFGRQFCLLYTSPSPRD